MVTLSAALVPREGEGLKRVSYCSGGWKKEWTYDMIRTWGLCAVSSDVCGQSTWLKTDSIEG
jgi:hypothetical protein